MSSVSIGMKSVKFGHLHGMPYDGAASKKANSGAKEAVYHVFLDRMSKCFAGCVVLRAAVGSVKNRSNSVTSVGVIWHLGFTDLVDFTFWFYMLFFGNICLFYVVLSLYIVFVAFITNF